jgi:hypothetical protein
LQSGEIGRLNSETERLAASLSRLDKLPLEVAELRALFGGLSTAKATGPVDPSPSGAGIPAKGPASLPPKQRLLDGTVRQAESEGVISYLTKKCGGNVHEKGIVIITSKSVKNDDPQRSPQSVADLTSDAYFCSEGDPLQWIKWDFRDIRMRPTRYTIKSFRLKSWVVEGSLDDSNWTEIDRHADNLAFEHGWSTAEFVISSPAEFQFIRFTQTGKNHGNRDFLILGAVEFFGTLSE